jgi:hypothetical protein
MSKATFIDDNLRHNRMEEAVGTCWGAQAHSYEKKPVVDSGLVLCLTFFSLIYRAKKKKQPQNNAVYSFMFKYWWHKYNLLDIPGTHGSEFYEEQVGLGCLFVWFMIYIMTAKHGLMYLVLCTMLQKNFFLSMFRKSWKLLIQLWTSVGQIIVNKIVNKAPTKLVPATKFAVSYFIMIFTIKTFQNWWKSTVWHEKFIIFTHIIVNWKFVFEGRV